MWKRGKIDKEGEREGEGKKERANFMDEICNNFHVFSLSLSLSSVSSHSVHVVRSGAY